MSKVKSTPTPELPEHLAEYRQFLVAAEQKQQEEFDKTVLSLSGGALGISFIFLKDVIGAAPIAVPMLLFGAWLSWGMSTLAVLLSYFLSHLALRRAIAQVDRGTIYGQRAGGLFARWTALLNAAGAILFVIGVCSITSFAYVNLSSKGAPDVKVQANRTTTSGAGSTSSGAATASPAEDPRRGTNGGLSTSRPATTAATQNQ